MAVVRIKKYLAGRLQSCREAMRAHHMAGLIVSEPADVRYLTGFSGEDSVLVVTAKGWVIVTDSRYVEQLRQECPGLRQYVRRGPMSEAVGEVWRKLMGASAGRKNVFCGIDSDSVTYRQYQAYHKVIGKGIKPMPSLIGPLRVRKDAAEIASLRQAIRVAQSAVAELTANLTEKMTEREAAGILDCAGARLGSEGPAFSSIVAFGSHAAEPHARPGLARLRKRLPILIDWGATINGYRSDLTRCFVLGKIPPVFAEAYRRVLEAQQAAIQAVKVGEPLTVADQAARAVLRKAKLPVYGHGTGHGIGLAVHENPTLSPKSQGVLEEGMVLTIEPAVYVPGRFGIRIEDDVLVTGTGAQVLSTAAKDLSSVSIR